MVSLAKKALALPLIGRGKLVLFWIEIVVVVGSVVERIVSRMAGEAVSAESAASAGIVEATTKVRLETRITRVRMSLL